MKASKLAVFFLLLTLPSFFAAGQTTPAAILEYFDNQAQIKVFDSDGFELSDVYFGLDLGAGDRVKTGETAAEIRLNPNGTILRLAKNTEFKVDSVQGLKGGDKNAFTIFSGKLRAVAARTAGSVYEVRTPSAVCGVRGTDFGVFVVPGTEESVAVLEGLVEFAKASGEKVAIAAGQGADAFAKVFQAAPWAKQRLADAFGDMDFKKLDPAGVPKEEAKAEPPKAPPAAVRKPAEAPKTAEAEKKDEPGPVMTFLRDHLGMEVGSVTIDSETYSRVIIQPVIDAGKFRAAFYLPIIYTGDLFNSNDWYKPRGNNEWSFGTDKDWGDDPLEGAGDLLRDLALKIQYVEYGSQRDPFFLKIGNLHGLTLGHGSLIRDYANDADFPAVRRVGLDIGADFGPAGIEFLGGDLAEPEVFGTRLYVRPFHPWRLALGASFAADVDPAGDIPGFIGGQPADPAYRRADPRFLAFALDADLPVFEGDAASLVLFGDVAGMVPYLRRDYAASTLGKDGFLTDAFYKSGEGDFGFRNYALMTGLFGSVSILDFRFEYRQYRGFFRPGFFGPSYDRHRADQAVALLDYLANPSNPDYDKLTLGLYGEAGFTLFSKLRFEAGYFWPGELDDGDIVFAEEDFLTIKVELRKGLIPVPPLDRLTFFFSYTRTRLVPTLLGEGDLELFDAYTVVKGELVYPLAATVDVALTVTTTVVRYSDGTVKYDSNGDPKWAPSVGIETRIHF